MIELVAYFLAGSFSLGYGAARIGFPAVQQYGATKKLAISFALGLMLFGISAGIMLASKNSGTFFLISAFVIGITFIILLAKRVLLEETDMEIVQIKRRGAKAWEEPQKEGAIAQEAAAKKPSITFEQGLMVKTRGGEDKQEVGVFKEKETNILKALNEESKSIEEESAKKKKEEALARLRQSARQIDEAKAEEGEEEEDFLTAMDEQIEKGSEEY